jgi:anaerobic selenocysteine-containing dehydrogenase
MKRRDFLKTGGTLGATSLLLDSCSKPDEKLIPLLVPEEEFIPGVESWVQSLCQQCSAGCGISVRLLPGESVRQVEGQLKRQTLWQAKKIEGNAKHPLNQGKTCARGQAGLQVLYNPDRIQEPLQRTGARGSGQYKPIAWEAAIQVLVHRLKKLQETSTPDRLVILTGEPPRASFKRLLETFAGAFGTPYLIYDETLPEALQRRAFESCTGLKSLPVADLENCQYLLSCGADLFETYLSPVRYNLAYGRMRQGRPGLRGKFVMAGPRLSMTAANADEWLPVRPGTEGLLALALAHIIVKELLYDREFVGRACDGFADYSKSLELYSPAATAAKIGISEETIVRVAREFSQRRPSLALGSSSDFSSLTAVYTLNALMGNFGKPGGILMDSLPPESTRLPAINAQRRSEVRSASQFADRFGSTVSGSVASLLDHLLVRQTSTAELLLLHEANPLYAHAGAGHLRNAIEKTPFIASFSSFLDESSVMADLILPTHTYLERWRDDVPEPGVGFPVRTLGQPVVKPRFNTRDSADVLLDIAKSIGGQLAEKLPWKNFEALVQESFTALQPLKHGSIVADNSEDFWEGVKAAGGWWNAEARASFAFRTSNGRFSLPKQPTASLQASAAAPDYPLLLHLYPSVALSDGSGANQPWLQELPDPMTTVMWGSWVELNPATAGQMGVREGDVLVVETQHGRLELPAYLYPGLRPEVIAIPLGQGHQQYGRYAANRGVNPLSLVPEQPHAGPVLSGIPVRVATSGQRRTLARFGASSQMHSQHPVKR